jgi:hypothetical protein
VRDGLVAHLGSRDVARVIYGAIVGLALVLALETHPPTAGEAAGLLVVAALAVGLAELVTGRVAPPRRRVGPAGVRTMARDATPVVVGAAFPAVFFVLAAAGAFEIDVAFALSKWTGVALLGGYAYLGARLAGLGLLPSSLHAAALTLLGGVLVAVKALIH